MYILLIVISMYNTYNSSANVGKAITSQQIEFSNKKQCESAATQVKESDMGDKVETICLKVKQ